MQAACKKIFEKNVRITNVFLIMRAQSAKPYTGVQKKAPYLSVRSFFLRISDFQKGLKDSS